MADRRTDSLAAAAPRRRATLSAARHRQFTGGRACRYAWGSTASAASAATSSAPRRRGRAPRSSGSRSTTSPTRATLAHLLKYDSILGPLSRRASRRRRRAIDVDGSRAAGARRARPGRAAVGRAGRRRRDRVDRASSPTARTPPSTSPRGAKKVVISAPATDPDVTVVLGVNFDDAYDRERAPHHLQRLVHDQLPGADGEGAARDGRDRARPDDDDPRVHRRPAPAGHAAQATCAARAPRRST